METTTTQVPAAEVYEEEFDYHDKEPFYYCAYCNKRYVVPSLARYCEEKHEAEE